MISISFLKLSHFTFVHWWIVDFKIEFSKYYLMMAILVKRLVDTQTYHQIWLRNEDNTDRGRTFSLNVSRFINNLLESKLRSYGLTVRAFKGYCITSIPVVRIYIEITNGNNSKRINCRKSVQG